VTHSIVQGAAIRRTTNGSPIAATSLPASSLPPDPKKSRAPRNSLLQ
jgi:hypothetical protein